MPDDRDDGADNAAPRLLCIEDDDRLRRLLVEELVEYGFEVAEAANAYDGFTAFFAAPPDLVVCDIRMPEISGFDLLDRLKRIDDRLFCIPFIFLTAFADRDNNLRGRRLGADDYVTKPVDFEILAEVIHIRLAGRSAAYRLRPAEAADLVALQRWFHDPAGPLPPELSERLRRHSVLNSAAREADQDAERTFGAPLNALQIGVLILNQDGGIRFVNETAAAAVGKPRDMLIGARLAAVAPALATLARRHTQSPQMPVISAGHIDLSPGQDPLLAIVRSAKGLETQPRGALTILLPMAASRSSLGLADLLRSLFGLTAAECALALLLAEGSTLNEVALSRGVSRETVRSQLKSVFGKLGVSRQPDLLRILVSLQMVGAP